MKIDGSCHCGQITYTAEVDPGAASICHCTDCQQLGGSAFRISIAASAEGFRLLSGKPSVYVKTTADNGNPRLQAFCGNCSSQMFSCDVENPQRYMLRLGTIAQRGEFLPAKQIWRRSALPWVERLATIPASEAQA